MRKTRFLAALAGLTIALIAGRSATAQDAFVQFNGIQGDSTVPGYVDHVEVFEFHHLVTGSGAANHEPIVFVKKRKERSTVDLLQQLDTQGPVQATFKFTRSFQGGVLKTVFEVQLTEAHVVGIEPWSRNDADGTDEYERVLLDYAEMKVLFNEYSPSGSLLNTESRVLARPR